MIAHWMMMSALTFYGGMGEIGGNKILLEDRGTRIFLDFGKSYTARAKYYDWTEKPRQANGVGDFLALGILPKIKGIYRRDLLQLARMSENEDKLVDALILSHAHSDHADYVSFLREDITVWMGETTLDIIGAIEEEKESNIEFEISRFKKRPIMNRREDPIERDIRTFKTGSDKIKIDSIEIEPVHVDHSLPGCYGFIIRTSSSTIVYSGDLRMHGNRSDLTLDFITRCKAEKPDVMICEGTRINESVSSRESDVYESCLEYICQAKDRFVFADYSYKDIDRFMTFYNIAKKVGRKILISPKTARYLAALSKNPAMKIPKLEASETIALYKSRAKSGSYAESDYDGADRELYNAGYEVWTCEDVKKNESRVILTLGSYHVNELIDLTPKNGIYLHSASEPFNEEGEIDEARMRNWMERFALAKIHAHCSGHASGRDLNHIVNEIDPTTLIPIHTEHPELFQTFHAGKVRLGLPQVPISL
ncbi:MAG: MBL fold metallo-hydrolase [Nitrososphaerales archaeon]